VPVATATLRPARSASAALAWWDHSASMPRPRRREETTGERDGSPAASRAKRPGSTVFETTRSKCSCASSPSVVQASVCGPADGVVIALMALEHPVVGEVGE
jgi:hypothetical protein